MTSEDDSCDRAFDVIVVLERRPGPLGLGEDADSPLSCLRNRLSFTY